MNATRERVDAELRPIAEMRCAIAARRLDLQVPQLGQASEPVEVDMVEYRIDQVASAESSLEVGVRISPHRQKLPLTLIDLMDQLTPGPPGTPDSQWHRIQVHADDRLTVFIFQASVRFEACQDVVVAEHL